MSVGLTPRYLQDLEIECFACLRQIDYIGKPQKISY